ncbi:hypothetical protein H6G80_21355 [Nostoc sp. FACHB-87]|uniref:hypothetical protein n=1 Tax=Nostocaceae TaxID=1162 RepID=UPI001686928D|nr:MULTISPECIES: hypothetical protein [Nostocaceae]MBD2302174.1 hypothetical protein [Nostoc sp. FACHB-190]MBD2456614.1 hypothetical protein [Nostoc sp. FACHB-87]MBD2477962.1 hypothetical protein [Anabaena sp. FACHB-83]
MSRDVVKVILWEEKQKEYLKKLYDLQFIPRIGEEIYINRENWKVTRIEHDVEVSEVNIYMEIAKKSKTEKEKEKEKERERPSSNS